MKNEDALINACQAAVEGNENDFLFYADEYLTAAVTDAVVTGDLEEMPDVGYLFDGAFENFEIDLIEAFIDADPDDAMPETKADPLLARLKLKKDEIIDQVEDYAREAISYAKVGAHRYYGTDPSDF